MTRLHLLTPARAFATTYSGRVVRVDSSGRALAVEVDRPELPRDARGHALPRRDLICRAAGILRSTSLFAAPLLDLADYLQTLTLTLTPAEVSEILKAIRDPDRALEFFRFAASLPGFQHDCFTYNRILSILARSGAVDGDTVRQIVDEMERDGVKGSISTINILIGILGVGELDRCLELVKKWGLKFNGYTYKCLMQAYLRYRVVDRAFRVYEEMKRKGYKLDIFAYNMLVDALTKAEKVRLLYS
ncbi:hypothetical protein BHM03_00039535 [Ensete ventricosum]|uniref:Pentacotripeptide-repeat region of PRORP domain-containing protein n=1 Tax=Ensete ventricosum TaxID=4639 RepID=A0A427ALG1_ENSVE|nr:hypothetical protein B296_00029316 [Ensete ventricosum]RZS08560.1 hypothetical protein BHM03_00039535 [Ensete ventricosum]